MEKPRIMAYSLESVIAEKFEAMVYLGNFNSRMKDFYDIYSISQNFDFNGRVLQQAISATFKRRGIRLDQTLFIFTTAFINSTEKKRQWNAFKKRIAFQSDVDFETVMGNIMIFLEPVIIAIKKQVQYEQRWISKKNMWEVL